MSMVVPLGNYPGVSGAYIDIARIYSSPALLGPKMCDELVALVEHMFTEEEADVVRYMKPWRPRTAAGLAKASGRPLGDVERILRRPAHERYILIAIGEGRREVFFMQPVVPGTFESVLIRTSPESDDEPVGDRLRRHGLHECTGTGNPGCDQLDASPRLLGDSAPRLPAHPVVVPVIVICQTHHRGRSLAAYGAMNHRPKATLSE